jgi:hypothetical protein
VAREGDERGRDPPATIGSGAQTVGEAMAHEKGGDTGELRHKYARTAARGRGAATPLSLPTPFLPMVLLFFSGFTVSLAPLVNPHTPIARRGSRGFGQRACDEGLPNRLTVKPPRFHI